MYLLGSLSPITNHYISYKYKLHTTLVSYLYISINSNNSTAVHGNNTCDHKTTTHPTLNINNRTDFSRFPPKQREGKAGDCCLENVRTSRRYIPIKSDALSFRQFWEQDSFAATACGAEELRKINAIRGERCCPGCASSLNIQRKKDCMQGSFICF